jgi:hypothetical protein
LLTTFEHIINLFQSCERHRQPAMKRFMALLL